LRAGAQAGLIDGATCETLVAAQSRLWALHAAGRLLAPGAVPLGALGAGGIALLLRGSDCADLGALVAEVSQIANGAAAAVADVLGKAAVAP